MQQWERHTDLAVYADADELTDLGVGGFADGAVAELAAAAAAEAAAAETARDALSLLFRLAGGSGTAGGTGPTGGTGTARA